MELSRLRSRSAYQAPSSRPPSGFAPLGRLSRKIAKPAISAPSRRRLISQPVGFGKYMKRFLCYVLLWSLLEGPVANADDWVLKPEVKESTYVFGRARIVPHCDSIQNTVFPKYTLRVYRDSELLAEHAGIGFDRLFTAPSNDYFVGVSNSGLTNDAYVVFDYHGKLLIRQPHDSTEVNYCKMSISLVRVWYEESNPDVKFGLVGGVLREISINGCDGKRVSLLKSVEGISQHSLQPTRNQRG